MRQYLLHPRAKRGSRVLGRATRNIHRRDASLQPRGAAPSTSDDPLVTRERATHQLRVWPDAVGRLQRSVTGQIHSLLVGGARVGSPVDAQQLSIGQRKTRKDGRGPKGRARLALALVTVTDVERQWLVQRRLEGDAAALATGLHGGLLVGIDSVELLYEGLGLAVGGKI